MKKLLSLISLVLVFVMLTTITASALGQFSAGVLTDPDYSLNNDGFKYVEKSAYDTGYKQNIFYGEYNTTAEGAKYEWVIHSIRNGNSTTLSTVKAIAEDYEKTTGRKVMMATNGDYFDGTGANVESYVNNGIVIKKGNFAHKHCIGFDNNGKVVVGRMTEVDTRLVIYDEDGQPIFFEIDKFNEQPAAGEIAIYNTTGSHTVANAGVLIGKTSAATLTAYPVWGTDGSAFNKQIFESRSFNLMSSQFAIVYGEDYAETFNAVKYGANVDIVNIPAGEFAGCTWVLGGYDILVDDYAVNTDCHDDNSGNADAPRTFIGFKEDGTGFLCVVDGRMAGGSYGIYVEQEAQLAGVLGAQYALELDGGGSSTMLVRINDELVLRNKPSDGSMRAVSNAIMLVEKPADELPHEHNFVEGKCECGETDPTYVPPHRHVFVEGKCECGMSDPTYVPTHKHNFVEGKCECGETDPNYVPPHEHNFVEGKCECGETDPTYVPPHEHDFKEGKCECGEIDPSYKPEIPEEPKLNFFQRIWQAILNFFRSLFGKK